VAQTNGNNRDRAIDSRILGTIGDGEATVSRMSAAHVGSACQCAEHGDKVTRLRQDLDQPTAVFSQAACMTSSGRDAALRSGPRRGRTTEGGHRRADAPRSTHGLDRRPGDRRETRCDVDHTAKVYPSNTGLRPAQVPALETRRNCRYCQWDRISVLSSRPGRHIEAELLTSTEKFNRTMSVRSPRVDPRLSRAEPRSDLIWSRSTSDAESAAPSCAVVHGEIRYTEAGSRIMAGREATRRRVAVGVPTERSMVEGRPSAPAGPAGNGSWGPEISELSCSRARVRGLCAMMPLWVGVPRCDQWRAKTSASGVA